MAIGLASVGRPTNPAVPLDARALVVDSAVHVVPRYVKTTQGVARPASEAQRC